MLFRCNRWAETDRFRTSFLRYSRVKTILTLALMLANSVFLARIGQAQEGLPDSLSEPIPAKDPVSAPASQSVKSIATGLFQGRSGTRMLYTIRMAEPLSNRISVIPANSDCTTLVRTDVEYWRPSLLLQGWYGNGFGDRIAGNTGIGPLPQGRNYGMDGRSVFRARRAQVALDLFPSGRELSRTGAKEPVDPDAQGRFNVHLMLDFARAFDGASHQQVLQDLTLGYQIGRQLRLEVGQQKTGLTEEGSRDDSRLLTVARAIMNEDLPALAGRMGDARDFGIALRYKNATVQGFVGLWDDNGATMNREDNNSQKFLDGAFYYTGIPHLKVGLWGGMNGLGGTPAERRDRGGATFIWQHGPHYLEGEVAYGRDYAAGAPAPGKNGSIARGAYWLYAHTISKRWQIVARYDNWDPAHQTSTLTSATTETGILIPHGNHKLREYTLGVNYYLPHDSKLQVNLIREDSEENAGIFFGRKRTILFLNFQTGLNAPTQPEPLTGAYDSMGDVLTPTTSALRMGFQTGPRLGFAGGIDVAVPQLRLLPGFRTRGTMEFLAEFNAPTFFGFPGTLYTGTLDQVTLGKERLYAGFGVGGYFDTKIRPGVKVFVGTQVSRNVGVEFATHFPNLGRAVFTLQTRVPL